MGNIDPMCPAENSSKCIPNQSQSVSSHQSESHYSTQDIRNSIQFEMGDRFLTSVFDKWLEEYTETMINHEWKRHA